MWHCLNANADKWTTAWWKTRRSGSTIQAAAEQVTESAAAALLVCSCYECRFEVVTRIVIFLKDYAISCWHPYWTRLQEIIWVVGTLQSEWSEVVKNALGSHLRTNYIHMYVCGPDTWHLSSFRVFTVEVPLGCACGDSVGKTNPLMWDITPKIAVYLWKKAQRGV